MKPLISVITVTFNAGKVIQKTLDSLKSQTFKDFEFIVIDGKSKDNTVEKVKASNIPHNKIVSEPDYGLYDAMNKGLNLANGEYVIFLNAGDSFHSNNILELYARGASKGKDIIYGDTVIVDSEGKIMAPRHLSVPKVLTKESFLNGMLICHQAFMVRKEIVPQYDLNYRFSADYDWCVKCIGNSQPYNCLNLETVTVNYLKDGLTDHNKLKSLRERFHIMSTHYGLVKTLLKHISFIFRALKRGNI